MNEKKNSNKNDNRNILLNSVNPNRDVNKNIDNFIVETETVNTIPSTLLMNNNINNNTDNNTSDDHNTNTNTNNIPISDLSNNTNNIPIIDSNPADLQIVKSNTVSTINSNCIEDNHLVNDDNTITNNNNNNNHFLNSSTSSVRTNNARRSSIANTSEPAFSNSLKLNDSNNLIAKNDSNILNIHNIDNTDNNDTTDNSIKINKNNQSQIDQVFDVPINEIVKVLPSNTSNFLNIDNDRFAHDDNSNSLIDNNPLPLTTQPSQVFLKNRKSALLVNSSSYKKVIDSKNNNEEYKIDKKIENRNKSIGNSNDKYNFSNANVNSKGVENNNDKNNYNNNATTKIGMLDKDVDPCPKHDTKLEIKRSSKELNVNTFNNHISDRNENYENDENSEINSNTLIGVRPVTKIIERPIISSMNSRDLLLTDKNSSKDIEPKRNSNEFFKNNLHDKNNIDAKHDGEKNAVVNKNSGEKILNNKSNTIFKDNHIQNNEISRRKTIANKNSDKESDKESEKKIINNIENIVEKNVLNYDAKNEVIDSKSAYTAEAVKSNDKKKDGREKSNDVSNSSDKKENESDISNNSSNELENPQKPNKTEFFAARLASAVGENEISDSEETFVYESAANSTKNLIYPTASNTIISSNNIQSISENAPIQSDTNNSTIVGNSNSITNNSKPHGVSSKMSAPLLNSNKKILSRLKNTRHTSTGGILAYGGTQNLTHHFQNPVNGKNQIATTTVTATSNLNTTVNPDNIVTSASIDNNLNSNLNSSLALSHIDDLSSMRSINHKERQNDIQSVHSFVFEQHNTRSPEKRLSSISLAKINNNNNNNTTEHDIENDSSKCNSNSSGSNNNNGNSNNLLMGSVNRQSQMNTVASNSNLRPNKNSESRRVLRTTVSKIFDTNGAQLRRYSGVPDNVNLEDFIEQTDDGLVTNKPNSNTLTNITSYNSQKLPEYYNNNFNTNDSSVKYCNGHASSNNVNNINGNTFYPSNSIKMNSYIYNDPKRHNNNNLNGSPVNFSNNFNHGNIIREEDEEQDYSEYRIAKDRERLDDDDLHSTFYYNHRSDLEARPQISDYEDDEEDMLLDNGVDNTYMRTPTNKNHPNLYSHMTKINPNGNYYPYMMGKDDNNNVNTDINNNSNIVNREMMNEYTPLRPNARKRISRNGVSLSPHNFSTKKSNWSRLKNFLYFSFVVVFLLSIGFLFGFILATNKELQDLNILFLDNIISSADELIFDMTVSAFNPGFFAIMIMNVQLDIFAKSEDVLGTEAMLLGSIDELNAPLKFDSGFLNRHYSLSMTTLKILEPGDSQADKENSRWRKVIKHDYQLVVKGTVKYNIPFFNSEKTLAVQKTTNVNEDYNYGYDQSKIYDDLENFTTISAVLL